ncbi:hypothetical protein Zmor_005873 [Zophobas morio]|uniref:Uncharacterized protein n=1 Tax=Zophobas morio TaxID=2755281 RepID=A0AA38MMU5_9CUCU|nr:hypothetical protein Zmor_005873 [Zophobas morio]
MRANGGKGLNTLGYSGENRRLSITKNDTKEPASRSDNFLCNYSVDFHNIKQQNNPKRPTDICQISSIREKDFRESSDESENPNADLEPVSQLNVEAEVHSKQKVNEKDFELVIPKKKSRAVKRPENENKNYVIGTNQSEETSSTLLVAPKKAFLYVSRLRPGPASSRFFKTRLP